MKKYFLLLAFFFSASLLASEPSDNNSISETTFTINGKVIESISGEVLTGVKIEVIGEEKSVFTDFDGEFEIRGLDKNKNYTLRIDFISYKKKIIRDLDNNQNQIIIKLQNDKSNSLSKNSNKHPNT